jgi:hypothetical protein
MELQERIGTWCAWGIILLSWIMLFLVLALMFRATGCNRRSEVGTHSVDVVAESVGFEARPKNGPLQPAQQSSLSSQPVSWFGFQTARPLSGHGSRYPRWDSRLGGR